MGIMISDGYPVLVKVDDNPTDNVLKDRVKNDLCKFNGEYAHLICRGCGRYHVKEDGNTDMTKIVNQCKGCFIPE